MNFISWDLNIKNEPSNMSEKFDVLRQSVPWNQLQQIHNIGQ